MTNQYINNSTEEEEQPKGFNKTGILMLKNRIDKIEYCLYNNKLPYPVCVENVDINEALNQYLYNNIRQPIYINISENNNIIFQGTGKLHRKFEHDIEKFYLDTDILIDIITTDLERDILFNNTDKTITIKINTVRNKESDIDEKEGTNIDESERTS